MTTGYCWHTADGDALPLRPIDGTTGVVARWRCTCGAVLIRYADGTTGVEVTG